MCWWILFSIVLLMAVVKARSHSLKAQDRIIRPRGAAALLQALLSPDDLTRSRGLTLRQIIGLRFASDEELPSLLRHAARQVLNLTEKQIKQAVVQWRADTYRV